MDGNRFDELARSLSDSGSRRAVLRTMATGLVAFAIGTAPFGRARAAAICVRKRHILIIVPANLRKQWHQELQDKFSLQALILEAQIAARVSM